MLKRKDNLTDLVEALQADGGEVKPGEGNQQVVDNSGQIITLGQNDDNKDTLPIKAKSLELSPDAVKKAVRSALEEGIAKFNKKG